MVVVGERRKREGEGIRGGSRRNLVALHSPLISHGRPAFSSARSTHMHTLALISLTLYASPTVTALKKDGDEHRIHSGGEQHVCTFTISGAVVTDADHS